MEGFVFGFLLLFLLVVGLPIATWVSVSRAKSRLDQMERAAEKQRETIEDLKRWIGRLQSKLTQLDAAPRAT
jgi:hypothetical protein